MKTHSYLALGDSYTIGEQVPIKDSFPYQAVQLLRKQGFFFQAPEIVAITGYTTDELQALIGSTVLSDRYDFVSLLIGVNNQYRGRPVDVFSEEFDALLQKAIAFAGGIIEHVAVISIPDWGQTPFAAGKDTQKISAEIDAYNQACSIISDKYGVHYIDITVSQRRDAGDATFLAPDQLHPSGKEYAKWAALLSERWEDVLSGQGK